MSTKVNCSRYECEANKAGKCLFREIHLYTDSLGLHCQEYFDKAEKAQGYVPLQRSDWSEIYRKEDVETTN